MGGTQTNAAPEFEDCRTAAAKHKIPVKQVIQTALSTYLARENKTH